MRRLFFAGLMIILSGCSGKLGTVSPPDVDAAAAANTVFEQWDRDGNGNLSADELAACPSLLYALPRYDTDGNRALSKDEVETGIDRWAKAGVGARSLPFRVQIDGRPLEGAQVRLVPESFLGSGVSPAVGEAGRGGNGFLGMTPEDRPANAPNLPLVQPGLYRVEITHPSQQIPAKYNSSTTLGLEVARDSIAPEGVVWSLTKRK